MLREKGDILVCKIGVWKAQQVKQTSSESLYEQIIPLFSTSASVSVTSTNHGDFLSFQRCFLKDVS